MRLFRHDAVSTREVSVNTMVLYKLPSNKIIIMCVCVCVHACVRTCVRACVYVLEFDISTKHPMMFIFENH